MFCARCRKLKKDEEGVSFLGNLLSDGFSFESFTKRDALLRIT